MEQEEKLRLVSRNTVEVVTEPEVKELLKEKKKPVAYCGYEPSGPVHLGHLVTIIKLGDLIEAGFSIKVLFADWHAWLNRKGDWDAIGEQVRKWSSSFRALGLKDAEYVKGTEFQMSREYIEDLFTLSVNTTVSRGMRSMQEVARDFEHATVSQMIYPLMQINDMKHLGVDVAQSGIEQRKIHMLAREIMPRIGYKKPLFVHTPLVNSLLGPGKKMSSSMPSSLIAVEDSEEEIKGKLKKAYCPEGEVEGNPVLEIAKLVVFPRVGALKIKRPEKFGGPAEFSDYGELEKAFASKKLHPADLKGAVAGELAAILEPAREAAGA
jgi:tyrosyl-tRNA synthetase